MKQTTFKMLVLPGDHCGPEVMAQALRVLDVIEECRPQIKIERTFDLVGGSSIDKHGLPITDAVLQKASESDAVLFGSVGGPEWADSHPNPEAGILALRHKLDAFANLRPCEFLAPSLVETSSIKPEVVRDTKFIVVRENCGGAYFGAKVEEPELASDSWLYTRCEVERSSRVSAAVARILGKDGDGKGGGGPATVWSADKANVLASGRLWRRVTEQVFKNEFPDVPLQHQLADSMAMLMVKKPTMFNGVIHTDNTFGDVLSDISGGIIGTLGTLPSASIAGVPGEGKCNGIYEPVHGSAPDIAGQNVVNPVAQILSLAMLLRYSYLLVDEAACIEQAVRKTFDSKDAGGLEVRSKDMGGIAGTIEVGDVIVAEVRRLLKGE